MKIAGSVALVTGANRGLGRVFADQLRERGATRVYATARRPADVAGAEFLPLDVTDPASIAAAADAARDVNLLISNAGVSRWGDLVTGDLAGLRSELDTNFWGPLHLIRAFAPVLGANGGGGIVTVLSRLSWLAYRGAGGYGVSKAAAWSLTSAVRLELAGQGTQVTGVLASAIDTDMSAGYDGPKTDPADVVRLALDGVEAGLLEVVADEETAAVKAALSGDPAALYPHVVSSSIR